MLNTNYNNLQDNYLFSTVARKMQDFAKANPDKPVIKMGIGDVTKPLIPTVIQSLHEAVDEMASSETFRGYGPEQGYDFVRETIANYYVSLGADIAAEEVFVSDGAKNDIANILDIFSRDCKVMIPDPVYPVYLDTNIMDGREVIFMDANESNAFLPLPPENTKVDLIYLCSPNNPTGAVYNKEQLQAWVDYANAQNAVILFDSAYESFITEENLPRSIFEIAGARTCAIEIGSLSKTAGFTGTRCSYTLIAKDLERNDVSLHGMWLRRQSTKFNGVPYIVQKAAESVFSEQGMAEAQENIAYYRKNARIMTDVLDELGLYYTGGKNSPYVWFKCPHDMDSWTFFDELLEKVQVVGTPGEGFGKNGSGFFRLTAFNTAENTQEAMRRLKDLLSR